MLLLSATGLGDCAATLAPLLLLLLLGPVADAGGAPAAPAAAGGGGCVAESAAQDDMRSASVCCRASSCASDKISPASRRALGVQGQTQQVHPPHNTAGTGHVCCLARLCAVSTSLVAVHTDVCSCMHCLDTTCTSTAAVQLPHSIADVPYCCSLACITGQVAGCSRLHAAHCSGLKTSLVTGVTYRLVLSSNGPGRSSCLDAFTDTCMCLRCCLGAQAGPQECSCLLKCICIQRFSKLWKILRHCL
jgi:hypothetical protein